MKMQTMDNMEKLLIMLVAFGLVAIVAIFVIAVSLMFIIAGAQ